MTALYRAVTPLPEFASGPLAAVDTETTSWSPPATDPQKKTRFAPFKPGKLVLGSIAYNGMLAVLHKQELCRAVRGLLEGSFHLVFHNIAFDWPVLTEADPSLEPLLRKAANECRLHDSLILEQLIQIAHGSATVNDKVIRYVSLADLAKRRAGMTLHKDNESSDGVVIRTTFDRFIDPSTPVPREYLEYAAADAEATYRCFISQWKEAQLYATDAGDCEYPIFDGARDKFGLFTEAIQIKAAVSLRWLEGFPMRVDPGKVRGMRETLLAEYSQLQELLIGIGWARRSPKARKFSTATAAIRRALADYAAEHGIIPQFTPTGKLTLKHDFWGSLLPRRSFAELIGAPSDTLEYKAAVWMRYSRVQKLLGTYLNTYSLGDAHYPSYHILGARTGRLSCVRPNVQNIPKHRDGTRALFVPRPGWVLIEGDYKSAELVTLAQIFHSLFGGSRLGDNLNAGLDPHIETAKIIVGAEKWATLTKAEQKRMRQASKAANFGFPGGLGAAKFVDYAKRGYSVELSLAEARAIRSNLLAADPALAAYLRDSASDAARLGIAAKNIGMPLPSLVSHLRAWKDEAAGEIHYRLASKRLRGWSNGDDRFTIPTRPGFNPRFDLFRAKTATLTGRLRGRASYTEAHNTPFQGLIADAIKLAVWNLYTYWTPDSPWAPVCTVHDSILIECERSAYTVAGALLEWSMEDAIRSVCPDIQGGVEVSEPLTSWGPNTDSAGNAITPLATSNT